VSTRQTTYFISDLHLSIERPQQVGLFSSFAKKVVHSGEALYILGDLFEVWIGDDDLTDALAKQVVSVLADVAKAGVKTYLMVGNRDFLIGRAFTEAANIALLRDPAMIELYGRKYLLMHGDTLCTRDLTYQGFRRMVRSDKWQTEFLDKPIDERRQLASQMRVQSEEAKGNKGRSTMDAVAETVEAVLQKTGYPDLIHGHTHRPARHVHSVDGHPCTRWVLPDWYHVGGYLAISPDSIKMRRIEFDQSVTIAK
jgi:UDP-2,3-diacylglucosamine hydrolase